MEDLTTLERVFSRFSLSLYFQFISLENRFPSLIEKNLCQAVSNVNTIIGPALIGKVTIPALINLYVLLHYDLSLTNFSYCKLNKNFTLFQDPTEQTQIDDFMVQQLDGTSNEWGWCKQKVS